MTDISYERGRALLKFYPWRQAEAQMVEAMDALAIGVIFWPSGTQTTVWFHAKGVATEMALASVPSMHGRAQLYQQHEENVSRSLQQLQQDVHPHGWFIKTDRRGHKQARKVKGIAWVHPDSVREEKRDERRD